MNLGMPLLTTHDMKVLARDWVLHVILQLEPAGTYEHADRFRRGTLFVEILGGWVEIGGVV